jgi:hypothetical protein
MNLKVGFCPDDVKYRAVFIQIFLVTSVLVYIKYFDYAQYKLKLR